MPDDNQALNGQEQPAATPTADVQATVEAQPSPEPQGEIAQGPEAPAETVETKPQAQRRPRSESRIRQLSNMARSQAQQFEQQSKAQVLQGLPWANKNAFAGKEEISTADIERRAEEIADQKFELKWAEKEAARAQQEEMRAWEQDGINTLRENPQLDPDSDEYDQELDDYFHDLLVKSNVVNEKGVLLNPKVKISSIVTGMRKILDRSSEKGTAQATASLAKSIAQEAVVPGGDVDTTPTLGKLRDGIYKDPSAVRASLRAKVGVAESD
jgi:hypothetical protein